VSNFKLYGKCLFRAIERVQGCRLSIFNPLMHEEKRERDREKKIWKGSNERHYILRRKEKQKTFRL
jgi:hypothetical protein